MTVVRTIPPLVTEYRVTDTPRYGRTVSGYGGAIPTRYMIRYAGRWHRVLMMQYGNGGSAYIRKAGADLFIDTDTEYALAAL